MTDLPMPVNRKRAFSASNAARFMACHAAADLEGAIPGYVAPIVDPTKGAKGRGTNMHAFLEKAIEFTPAEQLALAHALMYISTLRKRRRFTALVEETVCAEWLPSKPNTTADLVLYVVDEIHVVDYKMGRIPVDVSDNAQLKYYALCYAHLAPKAKGVYVHIVQPLIGNMVEEFIPAADLLAFMTEAIKADEAIIAGDHTFGPSDHCTFCPAYPHSRSDKGNRFCPATLKLLYPPSYDEDEILGL